MRIAFVAPQIAPLREPHLGGVGTLLTDIAAGVQAAGHEVTVFAPSGSEVDGLTIADTGVDSEALAGTMFRPLEPGGGRHPAAERASAEAFRSVYEQVGAGGFDIVHNHSFDAPAITLAGRAGLPVVHTLHLPPADSVSRAIAAAQAGPRPPVVASVSESHRRFWQRRNRIDLLLRAGIPTERIPWSEQSSDGLVFAGRISPEKGVLDAIAIAAASGKKLTIAGHRYDEQYARQVDHAVGRANAVSYAGSLNRRQLWELFARSSVLLFPIRWEEPFGMVTAEAQAAGCPVVGYRRGALSDVIDEGVTGIIVEPGDVESAAAAVGRALRLDRKCCRLHAQKNLDLEPSIEDHLRLYERLLPQ
ncbi:MAG TPA: glycosyltransferase [Actinomycetota bacterium]|nr:glycosyltransferase [Actinomycetota bacterium]